MLRYIFITVSLLVPALNLHGQTYMDKADSVKTWMDQRVENAKKGINEKVKMPMVVRSTGWGCECPVHYIGVSSTTNDGPWISAVAPKKFPTMDETGHSLVAVGYFTGKIIEQDMRGPNGEPEEWLYKTPEFKIISFEENKKDYDVDAPKVIGTYKK